MVHMCVLLDTICLVLRVRELLYFCVVLNNVKIMNTKRLFQRDNNLYGMAN